jgi:hypothetical protein
MNKSETIGKLAEALAKAQGVIEGAHKSSANPYFKSKYADLASVWDAIRKPLSENGLAVVQTGIPSVEADIISIETTLIHNSGEFISGIMSAKLVKNDPQAVGSAVTYLRRYSLSAIVGVSPEDDDGESATQRKVEPKATSKEKTAIKEDVPVDLGTENLDAETLSFMRMIPALQISTIAELAGQKNHKAKKELTEFTPSELLKYWKFLNKMEVK